MNRMNNMGTHNWTGFYKLSSVLARIGLLLLALIFLSGLPPTHRFFPYGVGLAIYLIFFSVGFAVGGSVVGIFKGIKKGDQDTVFFSIQTLTVIIIIYCTHLWIG